MVARLLWEQDAAGSNPVSPTRKSPVPSWVFTTHTTQQDPRPVVAFSNITRATGRRTPGSAGPTQPFTPQALGPNSASICANRWVAFSGQEPKSVQRGLVMSMLPCRGVRSLLLPSRPFCRHSLLRLLLLCLPPLVSVRVIGAKSSNQLSHQKQRDAGVADHWSFVTA